MCFKLRLQDKINKYNKEYNKEYNYHKYNCYSYNDFYHSYGYSYVSAVRKNIIAPCIFANQAYLYFENKNIWSNVALTKIKCNKK